MTEEMWAEFEAKIGRLSADPAVEWVDMSRMFQPERSR
jgi:hypothetical protein